MDQGPIDAGPDASSEYNTTPARGYSSDHGESTARKHSELRSASMRRSNTQTRNDRDAETSTDVRFVHSGRRRASSASTASTRGDPPQYPRVGATAEEIRGEVCVDDNSQLKEDARQVPQIEDADAQPHRMHKFTLYETNARYWITGSDITDKYFRLLRIDRTSPPGQIALFEDGTVYNRKQLNDVLTAIDQGNKSINGLRKKHSFWGLIGFIRFTEAYYMLIINKRNQAATIGGHYVYQIEGTQLVPLTTGASSSFTRDRNSEEARFLNILNNLDLTKSFYFSYSYDITHSLQHNVISQRKAINEGKRFAAHEFNQMFVWNHHLLKPAIAALKHPFDWCLPIVHGFLDQAALDVFGRTVYITVIGRRSRHFAGARFLKRGANDLGYVANDVETEQIVAEKLTTSFHAPGPRLYTSPTYTSYLHHRGSIPLYWTQDNSGVTPKPGIEINLHDPFFQPAALHFDHLFERYGCPIYVLNLVKAREKTPRESKLLHEYESCVRYLNQSLPADKKIIYKAYDMARAAKTRNSNVIGGLEVIAREVLDTTGFFHNGEAGSQDPQVQNGIARTNCIDCLDRTNAAQFVIGKHALALQLRALGVISTDEVAYDTDAINLFTSMFHDHGDNIAMQYGGSHLVNTMETYRKVSHWNSRDMMESFKRYYHNSFLDNQRQEAYNLFLGNYIWAQGQPMLWDLATDYYLHHSDPRAWLERRRRHLIHWYTPEFLEPRVMPPRPLNLLDDSRALDVNKYDDYWRECYRPNAISSIQKVWAYRMNSTQKYLSERPLHDIKHDFSPFVARVDPSKDQHVEKKQPRKGVTIVDPLEQSHAPAPQHTADTSARPQTSEEKPSILRESVYGRPKQQQEQPSQPHATQFSPVKPADKTQTHLWSLNQFHAQSLNPSVSNAEAQEYSRYITHPLSLPLVVSTELPTDANMDYLEYVSKPGGSAFDDSAYSRDEDTFAAGVSDADLPVFWDFVDIREDPLTVTEADGGKKRYKAYRQWLRGKSLFKQSKVDPEYKA